MPSSFESTAPPYIHLAQLGEAGCGEADRLVCSIKQIVPDTFAVRRLAGHRMTTEAACFAELAAALQFPYYFGHNWNAVNDCITDLEWLDAAGFVLIINQPELVLSKLSWRHRHFRAFAHLIRRLHDAGCEWATPIERGEHWDRPGLPFHTVLLTDHRRVDAVTTRLDNAAVPWDTLNIAAPTS